MDAFATWLAAQTPTENGVRIMHIEFVVSAAAWEAAVAAAAPDGSLEAMADAFSRVEREASKAAYRWYRGSGSQTFSVHFSVGEEFREVKLVAHAGTDASGRARVAVELAHEPGAASRRPRRR